MIKKVFANNKNSGAIFLASVGSVIGLSLLFISLQLYFDFKSIMSSESKLIDSDYLIIKKQIPELSILGANENSFTTQELNEITNASFVKSMGTFKGCRYQVTAHLNKNNTSFPGFSSLAYFESIPDSFIDVATKNWKWDQTNKEVPIILPSAFIDAYNFGIAISMGTPQLSRQLLSAIPFKVTIKGNQLEKTYQAKVISFSDRINSILVPETFLDYTNAIYGNRLNNSTNQVIIATSDARNPAIGKFLAEHSYTTNAELIKENKIQSLLNSGLVYQLVISLIIVIQSILLFIFYGQIIIGKSNYEIKTLLLLGFNPKKISQVINQSLTKSYIIIVTSSLLILFLFKFYMNSWMLKSKQIQLKNEINIYAIIIGILLIGLYILLNKKMISQSISKISQLKSN